MPHDRNNELVNKGDIVTIAFTVEEVYAGDDYCNVKLKSVIPMPPSNTSYIDLSAVNTKQTVKVIE